MSGIDIGAGLNKLKEAVKFENKEQPQPPLYEPIPDNWYRSLPYAFKAIIEDKPVLFYLPLNPKNINITTHFATNVISTLYGTVEEHSEQRYFDITISGTTGFAPRFNKEAVSSNFVGPPTLSDIPSSGRSRYEDFSISSMLGGFFPKTLGKIDQALNQAGNAVKTLTGGSNFKVGVYNNNSGYIAFHNFYKFLLKYKRSASNSSKLNSSSFESMSISNTGQSETSPLKFLNFKDNNQYSCAINRFVLERSAENPMLYNYTIMMRAYNLSSITGDKAPALVDRYKDLGLDSSLSVAAKLKLTISNGKGALSAGKSAVSTLGA